MRVKMTNREKLVKILRENEGINYDGMGIICQVKLT